MANRKFTITELLIYTAAVAIACGCWIVLGTTNWSPPLAFVATLLSGGLFTGSVGFAFNGREGFGRGALIGVILSPLGILFVLPDI